MKYDVLTIQNLRREKNPTDELLTMWGHHNHTISELFVLLSLMQHYQSMVPLKPFVHDKYHALLDDGESNLQKLVRNRKLEKEPKDLKIGLQNFNKNQLPVQNLPKVCVNNCTTEEQSRKILNQPLQLGQLQLALPSNSNNVLASLAASQSLTTALPQIPYSELAAATSAWNKHKILGKGGFGTVFQGTKLNFLLSTYL